MSDFSAEALGLVIHEHRQAQTPPMTQEELAKRAEYGKGARSQSPGSSAGS